MSDRGLELHTKRLGHPERYGAPGCTCDLEAATPAPLDVERLLNEMRKEFDDLPAWVKEFDDGTGAAVVRLDDVLAVLAEYERAATSLEPLTMGMELVDLSGRTNPREAATSEET